MRWFIPDFVIRNGDDRFDMRLGNWSDDIDDSNRSALGKSLQCDEETSRRITWARVVWRERLRKEEEKRQASRSRERQRRDKLGRMANVNVSVEIVRVNRNE